MTPARRMLSLLFLAACSGSTGGGSLARSETPIEPTVRDSSGVTIYELPPDAVERAPLIPIDSAPIAVVGNATPEHDVSRLFHTRLLSDGRLVGFDLAAGQVRVFSADGSPQAVIGRSGEGPGEFRQVGWLSVLPGDSIAVSDQAVARLTMIDRSDSIVGMVAVSFRSAYGVSAVRGSLADGSLLLTPIGFVVVGGDQAQDLSSAPPPLPVMRLRVAGDGTSIDTIAVSRRPPSLKFPSRYGGKTGEAIATAALSSTEDILGWQGGVATLAADRWEVSVRDTAGRLRTVYRRPGPLRATTPAMRTALIEQWEGRPAYDRAGPFEPNDESRFNAEHMPIADSLAPFKWLAARVTSGGILWLPDQPAPTDSMISYTALARDGRLLGRLLLPEATRVAAIGDDRIVFRTEDTDGIVRFEVHRLHIPE